MYIGVVWLKAMWLTYIIVGKSFSFLLNELTYWTQLYQEVNLLKKTTLA